MNAEWVEELATGNAVIDSQHKELFQNINNLLAACRERHGRDEVGGFLEYLKIHAVTHFLDEETLLLDHCYPLFREHREEHDAFIHDLMTVEEQFVREGATARVILTAAQLAQDWVRGHILQADRLMAEFVSALSIGTMVRQG